MNRAYYSKSVNEFLLQKSDEILGVITKSNQFSEVRKQQSNAWLRQIEILKDNIIDYSSAKLYFEYTIPRMGKRADNILIIANCIFIIEFKIGSKVFDKQSKNQVFDYGLDMNNFHEGSHGKTIIPILVADEALEVSQKWLKSTDKLYETICCNAKNLKSTIEATLKFVIDEDYINTSLWENSTYKPTPTIIEAATALFQNHSVENISRSDAKAKNLSITSNCISEIIEKSKKENRKSICFVTGVPGAGKTLAGLNIANSRSNNKEEEHAVFLSGNVPLVEVLREALVRDKYSKAIENGEKETKSNIVTSVKATIQTVHHFRDDNSKSKKAPIEKVTIFDEAQRAWNVEQTRKFMKENGKKDFDSSEPEFLIEVMNRHDDWCAIVCLIGGGQEINTGEVGLEGWIEPFKEKFHDWDIYYSSIIEKDKNYFNNEEGLAVLKQRVAVMKDDLHLSVPLRSFRSEQLSKFIQSIIDNDLESAKKTYKVIKKNYPIKITRDLKSAKDWLKGIAKGSERIGILASSGGHRLKPYAINVKTKIDAPLWFLNEDTDIRSSNFLEEIATEFFVQGLELDYACVAWDANFYHDRDIWNCKKFAGTKWQNLNDKRSSYLMNSYRVLLTRARQGMVIFIPEGNDEDATRPPFMYDGTFEFFKKIGIQEI